MTSKRHHGVVVQTRAVVLPQVTANGQYKDTDRNAIENFPAPSTPDQNWNAGVQIVQSIYQGGKLMAAVRAGQGHKAAGAGAISGHARRTRCWPCGWRITTSCSRRSKSP